MCEMIDSFRVSLCGRAVFRPATCCGSNQYEWSDGLSNMCDDIFCYL